MLAALRWSFSKEIKFIVRRSLISILRIALETEGCVARQSLQAV